MYSVTQACATAVQQGKASFSITGTLTLTDNTTITLNDSIIDTGSLEISHTACDGDELAFGGAFLGELTVSIRHNVDRYKLYGATIELTLGITYKSGNSSTTETLDYGFWTIAEATRSAKHVNITAYDNMQILDEELVTAVEGKAYTLLASWAEEFEFELAEDEAYYLALPNGDELLDFASDGGCATIRQAVGAIAQAMGCFAMMTGEGKLSLRQFSDSPNMTMTLGQRYSSSVADYDCNYVGLVVTGNGGTYEAYSTEQETGLIMNIPSASAWDEGVAETFQRRTNALFDYLETIEYTPCEVSTFCNPLLEIGDRVKLYTDLQNNNGLAVETLITSYVWKYRLQSEITSVGANKYLISQTTIAGESKAIREIKSQLASDKLVYYPFRNAGDKQLGTDWDTIAAVTFVASSDTKGVFNAQMQVNATIPDIDTTQTITAYDSSGNQQTFTIHDKKRGIGKVWVRYRLNEVAYEQDYEADLTDGSHIITLFQPLAAISKSTVNRFEVQMKIDNGTYSATVPDLHFIGSISGQSLATAVPWDGTIKVTELLEPMDITESALTVQPYGATLSIDFNDQHIAMSKSFVPGNIYMQVPAIHLLEIYDELTITPKVMSISRSYLFPDEWSYDEDNISFDGNIFISSTHKWESTIHTADCGMYSALLITTSPYNTRISLEVE